MNHTMKLLYPASHTLDALQPRHAAIKIARHSPCAVDTCTCSGLRPPLHTPLLLDDDPAAAAAPPPDPAALVGYGSDDDDDPSDNPNRYLDECAECGHTPEEHATDASISEDEFKRRLRVAVRLDELLHVRPVFLSFSIAIYLNRRQDLGKLLDFDYVDEDITSLRRQMKLPTSILSPVSSRHFSPSKSPVARHLTRHHLTYDLLPLS